MSNSLEQLRAVSIVVADSGDFETMEQFKPIDVTTNPSLILASANQKKYVHLVDKAVQYGKKVGSTPAEQLDAALDMISVLFGQEILKIIPGRVSTEMDSRLSFNKKASVEKAKKIITLYEKSGVNKDRILIKLAATWEGIQAAKELEEKYGIHTNLTLVFNFAQAVACAEAGVTLISPFVNRILDWYSINTDKKTYGSTENPGVIALAKIYNYYKKFGYKTEIMAASLRTINEIKQLAGTDLLTITPTLLTELEQSHEPIRRVLSEATAKKSGLEKVTVDEPSFRWLLNEDEMATELLASGIRNFAADVRTLEKLLQEKIQG